LLVACLSLTVILIAQERLQLPLPSRITSAAWQAPPAAEEALPPKKEAPKAKSGSAASDRRRCCKSPPNVASSQWSKSCTLLTDVCVDQGTILLYGEKHRQGPGNPGTDPYLIRAEKKLRKYVFLHRESVSSCPLMMCLVSAALP
jgi:hypothetical protein